MNELQKLIEKWDEQIALHRRVCDDPLMYTKEDRLKNSHYAQAICAIVSDLKKLTIPDVNQQREQLLAFCDHLNTYAGMEEIRFDFMMQDFIDKSQ